MEPHTLAQMIMEITGIPIRGMEMKMLMTLLDPIPIEDNNEDITWYTAGINANNITRAHIVLSLVNLFI